MATVKECPTHGPYDKTYISGWLYCSKCKDERELRMKARGKK